MKSLRSFLSHKRVCAPLVNLQGSHVRKYRAFRVFLDHNQAALAAIADLEQAYYGGRPFSLSWVAARYEALWEAVLGALYSLGKLAKDPMSSLEAVLLPIDRRIAEELIPRTDARSDRGVIPLALISPDMAHITGAKAANLARINNEFHLPVPEGFAITTAAAERFLSAAGLAEIIAKGLARISPDSPETLERVSAEIRAAVMDIPVPPDVAGEIRSAYKDLEQRTRPGVRVAVRSSAVGEDTEATFAGQYASVLNVAESGVLDAYKQVLASKYTPHAISYRLHYGLSDQETPMAAAVVAMIDPRASGVMYTNVSGGLSISSLWGLAERLVDGSATPDLFLVDRDLRRIRERSIAKKEYRLVNQESGAVTLAPVLKDQADAPSLDDDVILKLADMGLALEAQFASPQDVEWALDESGGLVILQSRPLGGGEHRGAPDRSAIDTTGHPLLLSTGTTAAPGAAAGPVFLLREGDDPGAVPRGAVLAARTAAPVLAKLAGTIAAIITDIGGPASHLASVMREFGVPMISGAGNGTAVLRAGDMVTLVADPPSVYSGVVEELVAGMPPRAGQVADSPLRKRLRRVLDLISPLNLTDPGDPSFSPEGCRTLHDATRYMHELAVRAMFGLTDEADEVRSIKLQATIPLELRLVDLGGGLRRGLTTCHDVTPEHVESAPFLALWKGFTHPGVNWEGSVGLNMNKMLTLLSASATSEFGPAPGGVSYAILSADYLNLSAKFGYHFATIDAFLGAVSAQNYVSLQFAGGAGSYYGKTLRVAFLGGVLTKLGFQVRLRGDLIEASITDYDRASLEDKLDQMGRLLASSRLMDLVLSNRDDVDRMTDAFFRADYDFLALRGHDGPARFYTHGGSWKRVREHGRTVCLQDGARAGFTISSGLAGVMGRFVGQALQEFLDNVEAYYYFPMAVAKDVRLSDGTVSVRTKPLRGNIDRAGGILFGMREISDYFVFRINALEDNAILFEFVNGRRIERARTHATIASGQWHDLRVIVHDRNIHCYVNGLAVLHYSADKPVRGYVGLWTKADSVTLFDGLTIETEGGVTTVACGAGDEAQEGLQVAWKTVAGKRKTVNEDALLVDRDDNLFLLADGMSGPRAGRVASRLAVRRAYAYLKDRIPTAKDSAIMPLLKRALSHAHEAVQKASLQRRALRGMGTTLMVLCLRGTTASIGHVGDSRAYLQRAGSLEPITSDHTVEQDIENAVMIRELFFFHRVRVPSQALGPSKTVVCDGHTVSLRRGDLLLLCSDGLTDMLSDNAIGQIIELHRDDLEACAESLVEAANAMGGKDNISVILIAI